MEVRHSLAGEVFDRRNTAITRGFVARNYSIVLHDHDFYEINIVLSGSGTHRIEGYSFTAREGDVFVIPPRIVHGYEAHAEGFNVFHLIARKEFFLRHERKLGELCGFRLLFEIEPYLRRQNRREALRLSPSELSVTCGLLELFEALKGDTTADSDTVRESLTLTVIGYLSRLMADEKRTVTEESEGDVRSVMRAMEYVAANLDEKLTVDGLAAVALMSRATFIRKFSALCKTSPYEYVLSLRVKEARRLLALGRPRSEAASRSGFFDVSHMEKTLRKHKIK